MKKFISLLVVVTLVLSMAVPVFAAPAAKVGMVKGFTDSSITISVNGNNYTYKIDKTTKILLNDMPSDMATAAYKGVKATFKTSGTKLTEINFNEIGEQYMGDLKIAITYPREMLSDTSTAVPSNANIDARKAKFTTNTKTEIGEEEDSKFVYRDTKTIDLGPIDLIPDSLKVTVNGKDIKVIYDEKTEFDPAVAGDEVKISRDTESEDEVVLTFEKDFTDNAETTQEDAEKIIKVSYKKKIYSIAIAELYKFSMEEDVYIELNGKETTLPKAMNRGTYATFVLNPEGRIIYINSFYQDLECKIDSIKGNTMNISCSMAGKAPFKDTVILSPALSINGGALTIKDLKVGDTIKITVDPYDAYRVTSITK